MGEGVTLFGIPIPQDAIDTLAAGKCPSCEAWSLKREYRLDSVAYSFTCSGPCCDNEALVMEKELLLIHGDQLRALVWLRWMGAA